MKVLIVDDSEVLVHRLTSRLGEIAGIEIVGQAGNVADATMEIARAKPDVIILDIRMPGGSGIEVLEGLKEDSFRPVVIVLTNCDHRQYRRKCLESGAGFYFDKSAEFHKVGDVLRGLLETTRREPEGVPKGAGASLSQRWKQ